MLHDFQLTFILLSVSFHLLETTVFSKYLATTCLNSCLQYHKESHHKKKKVFEPILYTNKVEKVNKIKLFWKPAERKGKTLGSNPPMRRYSSVLLCLQYHLC